MPKFSIVLLAAGGSQRMERSKPLLPWGNTTLLENRIQNLQLLQHPITLILGYQAKRILPIIQDNSVNVLVHSNWKQGMGSSIAFAVQSLMLQPQQTDGVLFTTIDQPFVDVNYLNLLLAQFHPQQKQIIVSRSDKGWTGIPALFDKEYFQELSQILGDVGAKVVIKKHQSHVKYCSAGKKLVDMDTPESYQKLLKQLTPNSDH